MDYKKAQTGDALSGLAMGVIGFALIIGIGTVVLTRFGGSVAACSGALHIYNESSNTCHESTNTTNSSTVGGAAYTATNYINGQLGQTGLAGWVPAIIALTVGILFLALFFRGKSRV